MEDNKLFSYMISKDGDDYQVNKEALSVYIKNLKKEIQAEEQFLEISRQKIEKDRKTLNQLETLLKSIS
ncbi:hypothetical protein H5983_04685 [Faecalitalea cylindroides]|uniref:hypothetical protein n=1 Tax=Faecalitalea cylindroides TaxID=39483 RepID=UPI001957C2C1|nr:hypothetical protein [Faecalitalea cylindroides]MBM6810366.1 hypothetical protein [Faecalitalea cylindroides]